MRRNVKLLIALFAAVLIASACGSRLPDQTLKAIDDSVVNGGSRGGGGSGGGTDFAAGTGESTDSGTASADTGAPDTGGGATAAPSAGGAAPGAASTGAQPAAATNCTPSGASSPGVSAKEIKTASIVTDSGPLPGATEGAYRGAAAYFAMINSQGGVCGRKLTLLKGDDGRDPGRPRGEFLRLEPQVLSIVGAFSV